jgi:acyl-CoA thioester hydrolase
VSWAYTHRETVRFGDLDAMRHLNNVVFLRYFETARISYFNALLESHDPVNRSGDGFGFIFAACHIDYRSPAYFDEDVDIRLRPSDLGTKSLKLEFEMAVGDRVIAEGHGVLVGYDYADESTVPLPDALRERLR